MWLALKISANEQKSLGDDDGYDGINIQRILSYCPIYREDNIDLYSYDLLVLCLLIVNSFFLFWIMGVSSTFYNFELLEVTLFNYQIVLSKLRSQTAMDHDRKHLKAAKALVIVIPLFGFTYILTFIGPDEVSSLITFRRATNCVCPERVPPWIHNIPVLQGHLPLHHGVRHHPALLLL